FVNADTGQPITLAEHAERCHPGINSAIWRLLLLRNESMPLHYLTGDTGLYCNYWVMSKENFNEYMNWSYPLVRWCLVHPDGYCLSHPRAVAYLAERLFICWYCLRQKRIVRLGPVIQVGFRHTGAPAHNQPEQHKGG